MSETNKEAVGGFIAFMVAFVVFTPILVIVRAWAFSTVWDWYIVGAFGVPTMDPLTAVGISALVGLMTSHRKGQKPENAGLWGLTAELVGVFVSALMMIGLTTGIAWIGTLFM